MGATEGICPRCGEIDNDPHVCAADSATLEGAPGIGRENAGVSFAERYRGTQWDNSGQPIEPLQAVLSPRPDLPHEKQPEQRFDSRTERKDGVGALFIIGVVSMLLALGGIGFYTISYLNAQAPAVVILPTATPAMDAVALGSSPTPATTPSVSPSASPSPTAPASPTPRPTLGPLPDDPVAAFAWSIGRDDTSYVVDCSGTFAIGNERGTIDSNARVSGQDMDGTFEIDQDRVRVRTSIIVKDGVEYLRPVGDTWYKSEGPPTQMPADIFAFVEPYQWQSMENAGTEKRRGQTVHHLRVPAVDWQALGSLFIDQDEAGVEIRDLRFDLWITPRGEPVEATIVFDGTIRSFGVELDMTYELEYRYSQFGEPQVIEPPADFEDGGQTTS